MNKKGFTLIEVIVVLTIVASLAVGCILVGFVVKAGMQVSKQGLKPTVEHIWYGDSTKK